MENEDIRATLGEVFRNGVYLGALTMQASIVANIEYNEGEKLIANNYIGIVDTQEIIEIEKAVYDMATIGDRLDKLFEKVNDIDKRLVVIETNTSTASQKKATRTQIIITILSIVVTGGVVALITKFVG